MPIWQLATILYVQLKSDLTAKCLNIDCEICSQFIFEELRKFYKSCDLMGLIISRSCAEMVIGFERKVLLIKNLIGKDFSP